MDGSMAVLKSRSWVCTPAWYADLDFLSPCGTRSRTRIMDPGLAWQNILRARIIFPANSCKIFHHRCCPALTTCLCIMRMPSLATDRRRHKGPTQVHCQHSVSQKGRYWHKKQRFWSKDQRFWCKKQGFCRIVLWSNRNRIETRRPK